MKHIDFIICGCGCRGTDLTMDVIAKLDDVSVIGVCDHYKDTAENLADKINAEHGNRPEVFTDHAEMFRLMKGKADAVLAASLFHFGEIPIPELKKYLNEKGIPVRL